MLKLNITRPPQQSPNDAAQWVARGDCWDHDRINAEKALLDDADRHPVEQWYAGVTRWSLHPDAVITVPEELRTDEHPEPAVPVTAYLSGKPTAFEIRMLPAELWREALVVPRHMLALSLVKHGLVQITGIDDGKGGSTTVKPDRDGDGAITSEWLDAFDVASHREIIEPLGGVIFDLAQGKAGDAEGKL